MVWWPDGRGTDTGTGGGAPGCYLKLCPYGQPGDRLWVRETWHPETSNPDAKAAYRADCDYETGKECGWRPSIHMPRWASRILLEITDVRVERLQDIDEDDCLAEGIAQVVREKLPRIQQCGEYDAINVDPVAEYRDLWESISGAGSWDAKPWVWVIEFRRVS